MGARRETRLPKQSSFFFQSMLYIKSFWRSVAQPPFRNLPWLVWGYVALAYTVCHKGGVFTGHLYGFDDHVRMVQVLDWVNGGGFYERTILRANGPEGFTSIWARLVDMPIALTVLLAQHFVPQKTAALMAATVVPLIELALLFVVAPYFTRPLVGKAKARLIVLFLLFSAVILPPPFSTNGFVVGSVSHRPWYTILYLVMFGAVARIVMGSLSAAPTFTLALSTALSASVGIESYPMIAGVTVILAFTAFYGARPKIALQGGYGLLGGALGSTLLLPLFEPLSKIRTISFAAPSILAGLSMATAGGFLIVERTCLKRFGNRPRQIVMVLTATLLLSVALFVISMPQLLDGAGVGLSPAERAMAFRTHLEAKSFHRDVHTTLEFLCFAAPLILSLGFGLYASFKAHGRKRLVRMSYLGFALLGSGLSEIFARYYQHAQTTACVWLLWGWLQIKKTSTRSKAKKIGLSIGTFSALLPVWMVIIPFATRSEGLRWSDIWFPAFVDAGGSGPCDVVPFAAFMNERYGDQLNLLTPYWISSQFLYHTNLKIDFLANYPSQDKFIDNFAFFGTFNPETAHQIAARHKVDLLVLCRLPSAYNPGFPDTLQPFVAQLQRGKIPSWLRPISLPDPTTQLLLFEVIPGGRAKRE